VLVKIAFYGVYRDFLDCSGIELDLPEAATVRDLLIRLSESLGQGFRQHVLSEDGGLHRHVSLSVNDRQIKPSDIDERLSVEDASSSEVSVLFIPPMMGGT